jgi:hypothetical protein
MKAPSFQFYPGDWLRNANLCRCTHQEKGVWIDVLCLMHDSEERGILRWTLKEIASAIGSKKRTLESLVSKGVLKGCDEGVCTPFFYTPRSGRKDGEPVMLLGAQPGPIWYSTRFLKDDHIRVVRTVAGGSTTASISSPLPGKSESKSTIYVAEANCRSNYQGTITTGLSSTTGEHWSQNEQQEPAA